MQSTIRLAASLAACSMASIASAQFDIAPATSISGLTRAGGVAAVHRIRAMDAIEIEEQGDSGPAYLVKTDDGARLAFVGQYLERYRAKGFPWTEFEILEAPRSKLFFGLVKIGARLPPSAKRAPLGWDEYQRLAMGNGNYRVLDPDHWDALARAVRPGTGDRETTPRGEGT